MDEIIETLMALKDEPEVKKNMKLQIEKVIAHLQGDPELGKDRAITEIEDMVADSNMDPYLRSQIWSVVSMIESS